MKKENFKDLSTADLKDRIEQMEKEYRQQKINHTVAPLANTAKITLDRRDIARAKTELRARELAD